jgi:competence protein ComEC
MSAVIGLIHENRRLALITGDIDWVGLQNLRSDAGDIRAEILIFPHHGGRPGGLNSKAFAAELCSRVEPSLVIFSMARSRSGFPRSEVVESVTLNAPQAHIACTQLAQECAKETPPAFEHLMGYPARGRETDSCCAGTIRVEIGREESYSNFLAQHTVFVRSLAPTMCQRRSNSKTVQIQSATAANKT